MKAGRPVWRVVLLIWLYFLKFAFTLSNSHQSLVCNGCCLLAVFPTRMSAHKSRGVCLVHLLMYIEQQGEHLLHRNTVNTC